MAYFYVTKTTNNLNQRIHNAEQTGLCHCLHFVCCLLSFSSRFFIWIVEGTRCRYRKTQPSLARLTRQNSPDGQTRICHTNRDSTYCTLTLPSALLLTLPSAQLITTAGTLSTCTTDSLRISEVVVRGGSRLTEVCNEQGIKYYMHWWPMPYDDALVTELYHKRSVKNPRRFCPCCGGKRLPKPRQSTLDKLLTT